MDLTQWSTILALASNPAATIVLAFFVWKLTAEVKEMKRSMYQNGFVHRKEIVAMQAAANREHDELWRFIRALDERRHDTR